MDLCIFKHTIFAPVFTARGKSVAVILLLFQANFQLNSPKISTERENQPKHEVHSRYWWSDKWDWQGCYFEQHRRDAEGLRPKDYVDQDRPLPQHRCRHILTL